MADEPSDDLQLVSISPDGSYSPEYRQKVVDSLGDDGAWLVTSILHYGWRAQYDLARSLASAATWQDVEDPIGPRGLEFQIVRDLQIQGHMYAAAEQLAALVQSLDVQASGGDFFESYVSGETLRQRVDAVRGLTRERVAELVGMPESIEQLRADLEAGEIGPKPAVGVIDLDPHSMPTVEVGGLHIPQSTMDQAVHERMWDGVNDLVDGIHRNLAELGSFVDRPPTGPGGVKPQSLREVDNSFRHGLRVLFHRAIPNERTFRALELGESQGTHLVDVYLPRPKEPVRFATVACSPERSAAHVDSTRMLCLRIGQVVRGFLGRVAFENSGWLMRASSLTLGGRTDAEAPPEDGA